MDLNEQTSRCHFEIVMGISNSCVGEEDATTEALARYAKWLTSFEFPAIGGLCPPSRPDFKRTA